MIWHGYHQNIETLYQFTLSFRRWYERMSQEAGMFSIELFAMLSFLGVNLNESL